MKRKEIECVNNCILFSNSFCLHTLKIYIAFLDHEYQSDEDDFYVNRRNRKKVCRYYDILFLFCKIIIIYRQGTVNMIMR